MYRFHDLLKEDLVTAIDEQLEANKSTFSNNTNTRGYYGSPATESPRKSAQPRKSVARKSIAAAPTKVDKQESPS